MATASTPAPPQSGPRNVAPSERRLGRILLLGIVVIAVAAAYGLNHDPSKPDIADWTGVQMNGTTSQHQPIFAVERKGAVRAFYMNWRVRCPSGITYIVGGHFREPMSHFARDGRAFTLTLNRPTADGRRSGIARATVSGRLSDDLRTAEGFAERTIAWHGGGRPRETCTSGRVHWHATLAPGLKPN
jgi:hypothetical protein